MRINSERSFAYFIPLILCLLLTGAVLTQSRHTVGLGVYALQAPHFPCDSAIKVASSSKRPALAVLWHTFGDDTKCLKRFLSQPGPKALEIHLINEVCAKNRRCGSYEFLAGYSEGRLAKELRNRDKKLLTRFTRYATKVHSFLKPYFGTFDCLISPLLESSQWDKDGAVLVDLTRQLFPECRVVWSPRYPRSHAHADLLESHEISPKVEPPCLLNPDGANLTERQLGAYIASNRACEYVMLWRPSFNLNLANGGFHDPRKRSVRPSQRELESLTRYIR